MLFGNIDIPKQLIDASLSGDLVVFAGAGVSVPSPVSLPSFDELIEQIKRFVDPADYIEKRKFKRTEQGELIYTESPEQYLSFLENRGKPVKSACSEIIDSNGLFNDLHKNVLRMVGSNNHLRLVTTNFDNCFENALLELGQECKTYNAPALPVGSDFRGLVHLHGLYDEPKSMVLTAEDYGKAYVTNGWASRFLTDLFKTYVVLFVGYSCGDSLVDYLTRSISSEINGRSFALSMEEKDIDAWKMRGVEPVVFNDFNDLPTTFDNWAIYLESSLTDKVVRIRDICQSDGMSQNDEEFLVSLLTYHDDDKLTFTDEYCKYSKSIESLHLLKKYNLIGFLTSEKPSDAESLLLKWCIENFAIPEMQVFEELCMDYLHQFSSGFYRILFWNLAVKDVPESTVGAWLPWLESTSFLVQKQCEYDLIEIAKNTSIEAIILACLRILIRVHIGCSRSFLNGMTTEIETVASNDFKEDLVEIVATRGTNSKQIIFDYCFDQIEQAYAMQSNYWTRQDFFDGLSFNRSSIAPHDQDQFSLGTINVLVDIARESINEEFFSYAMEKCFSSRCALLIRLGLWIKYEYDCLGTDLNFVKEKDYLSDYYLRHEVFALTKKAFERATSIQKDEFVQYLASRIVEGDRSSEYECYNICNWLLSSDANHVGLEDLREQILVRNPGFVPAEYPDFICYISSETLNDNKRYSISVEEFTNEHLLTLLNSLTDTDSSLIKKHSIIADPVRNYPLVAIENLQNLLEKNCSIAELELMNSYVSLIEWDNDEISQNIRQSVLNRVVSDTRTCVAGIKAIESVTNVPDSRNAFSNEELCVYVENALSCFDTFLESKSSISRIENHDWVSIGINHPAGIYVNLLSRVGQEYYELNQIHKHSIQHCFEVVCEYLSKETDSTKCIIACLFTRVNYLQQLNPDLFKKKLVYALSLDNWAFSPAWEGLSYSPMLTAEVWDAIKELWPQVFKNSSLICNNQFNHLVRLYVWALTVLVKTEDRDTLLVACAAVSKDSLKFACLQLNKWLQALSENERVTQWKDWLSEAFKTLSKVVDEGAEVLIDFYSRWVREFPELRSVIAYSLTRDCSTVDSCNLFIQNGVFFDIANDPGLNINEKVVLITFLLEHHKDYFHEDDVRSAIALLDFENIDTKTLNHYRDAITRHGLADTLHALAR